MFEAIIRLLMSLLEPSKESKGASYERTVRRLLAKRCDFRAIYRNILIPDGEGTTECDLLLLGLKGLYVIECKNYSGKIYGRGNGKWWSQYLNGKEFKFYNPILQNKGHCDALSNYFKELVLPIFSIVVFADKADLSKIVVEPGKYNSQVCKTRTLLPVVEKIAQEHVLQLSESALFEVQTALDSLQVYSEGRATDHASYVKEKFKGTTCPVCGAKLIKRKGKTWFWGCSSYPQCRYTRPINPGEE